MGSSFAQTCQAAWIYPSMWKAVLTCESSYYDFQELVIDFMWDDILKSEQICLTFSCVIRYNISSTQCSAVQKLFARGSSFAQTCQAAWIYPSMWKAV